LKLIELPECGPNAVWTSPYLARKEVEEEVSRGSDCDAEHELEILG
jgi:hypothetical protein